MTSREPMDSCPNCGARLAPTLPWCPQCLTAVGTPGSSPSSPSGSESPLWVRTQLRDHDPAPPTVHSRWKASPTSFGVLGRTLLSICVLAAAVIGYPLTREESSPSSGPTCPARPS